MLPVAQLYLGDVPHLRVPKQADMMQVLWCPFDHPEQQIPKTALFWRPSTRITDVLASAPQPAAVQHEGYVPQPCLIHPAQVTEYPAPLGECGSNGVSGLTCRALCLVRRVP